MRAKLVADLVRGRHPGKAVEAAPEGDPAEGAPPAEPAQPPPEPRTESPLFFDKGVASATGFRPSFWSYRRKAKAEKSPAVPAETAVADSPATAIEIPAASPASPGIDVDKLPSQSRESEDAPPVSRPDGADNVVALVPEARPSDAPTAFLRRFLRSAPKPAPPAPAPEPSMGSPPDHPSFRAPRLPEPLDEAAVAQLLASGGGDASPPSPEPPAAVAAPKAEPNVPTPALSTLADRNDEEGERRPKMAALDESAVAALLAPGKQDAPERAALPEPPLAVEARDAEPDVATRHSFSPPQEKKDRSAAPPEPMSPDEAATAALPPPADAPERIEALSPPVDASPTAPDAAPEIAAGDGKESAAFPADAPHRVETPLTLAAAEAAAEALPTLDLRDRDAAAEADAPAGLGEPPAWEHPADRDEWQDGDGAAPAPPPEEPGWTSEADPSSREAMIESLGAAIESVLSERRYGSPQPARQTGFASYRSTAVEAVTCNTLLDELGAARPPKIEEPPPPKKSYGFLLGFLGAFLVLILSAYILSKLDLSLDDIVRQLAQLVS
ncbi:MAG TPA: hypothetical protein VEI03_13525 [Stellaceae bacterium]|nr:hypothetical protein [Stellaceae bacterium]